MDFKNAYATNEKAEQEGRYFENGDVEFLIARAGNDRYQRMITKQYEGNKHLLDDKSTPEAIAFGEDLARRITIDVMSKAILLGWRRPLLDADRKVTGYAPDLTFGGQPLVYSVDAAQTMLGMKEFQNWVASKAGSYQNYLLAAEEDDAKNSVTTSSGTSNGEVASTTSAA